MYTPTNSGLKSKAGYSMLTLGVALLDDFFGSEENMSTSSSNIESILDTPEDLSTKRNGETVGQNYQNK